MFRVGVVGGGRRQLALRAGQRARGVLRRRPRDRARSCRAGRREGGAPGDTTPVPLAVEGTVRNLLGQTITLTFQEVREPGAIYYLATTRFTDREALRFELTVEDLERGQRHALSFQKTLWAQ